MGNHHGSAVAIVLLILGVSSLVGVALLSRSRLDVRVSSAVTTYDRIFGAADGASAIALVDLQTSDRTFNYSGDASAVTFVVKDKSGHDLSNIAVTTGDEPTKYTARVEFAGFTTDPGSFAGWEIGEFYPEFWRGEGEGKKDSIFGGTKSIVDAAVSKMKRKM